MMKSKTLNRVDKKIENWKKRKGKKTKEIYKQTTKHYRNKQNLTENRTK